MGKKKCAYCKEYADKESDEAIQGPISFYCSIDCMSKHGHEKQQKAREKQFKKHVSKCNKDIKASHKADKERIKPKGDYMKEAQAAFNKYIRVRDHGKPCISCLMHFPSQKIGGVVDAGHYRSRGAAGHLRFNVFNCHSQCVKCNRYRGGNAVDYRINLIERIGLGKVELIESNQDLRSFDIEYLKRVKRIFNKKARLYEKKRAN